MRTVRFVSACRVVLASAFLAGCVGIVDPTPINEPAAAPSPLSGEFLPVDDFPELAVGLAFSGGGMRAAAFSFGVLQELDAIAVPGDAQRRTLLDAVDLVAGISGGSVTAAYFGLKQREALADFRERFLLQDAEASFSTSLSLPNILNLIDKGGANGSRQLGNWLDSALFDGATFADFRRRRNQPAVWIAASDLYNRIPFVFSRETFAALCSDLDRLPVAQAVAASAAFPAVFAPVNVESFRTCDTPLPGWTDVSEHRGSGSSVRRAVAAGLRRYRDASLMRYVKLADGGVTDNFGIQSIALARGIGRNAYDPLTPETAVRLRRALFLVVNAGRGPAGDWALDRSGPGGATTIEAVADAAIDANSRAGYDHFRLLVAQWRDELVRWRCSLGAAEARRLAGSGRAWNCRDLEMFVDELSFADTDPEREAALNAVPTRFRLPAETIDFVVESGRIALRNDAAVRRLLASMRRRPLVSAAR